MLRVPDAIRVRPAFYERRHMADRRDVKEIRLHGKEVQNRYQEERNFEEVVEVREARIRERDHLRQVNRFDRVPESPLAALLFRGWRRLSFGFFVNTLGPPSVVGHNA